ncbi:MAG TPA: thiamine pyrophosphate-dependent enzyme [Candidatus Pacearchaeota archaeon]|nr:thiamine pyrophosphate-dependent enzyme [Candidatus Pacearchaeota archaeon]HOU45544.1 thiamine pyrophosphate-dependent enzyme [Candidatus Pacearchaeota archaeon]HPM08759.1 thiamine pyrophosphate-dependent enzyme [Candidatus Pacearchaeota archaeon]HQI74298.1 thiamine pyrophosphate-dependent enzyme [Candidatus Pacearchaeota archaeon]
MDSNLDTKAINTWCPGCGNFGLLAALKKAVNTLISQGVKKENILLVSGVGCHAKIIDYININTFYGLHGRSIASAVGAKIANPDLKVIVCTGDGASLNEGLSHLVHAAKMNIDITVLMHDNRVFALTTGQFTATTPKGFKGKSTPFGSPEENINPLELMMASNAMHISRSYTGKIDHLSKMIVEAVNHKGFSFVEVLQPCIAWYNNSQIYNNNVYEIPDQDLDNKEIAEKKIREWNYISESKISLGTFYKKEGQDFNESIVDIEPKNDINQEIQKILSEKI